VCSSDLATKQVRYAVIGAGNIAQVAVLPSFAHAKENSELVAIVSSDAEKREALKDMYGLRHAGTYVDLEQVLADADADAAYIALPNSMHREYTERCAAAGVHVLCEKPMAMTSEDCEAMINACEAAGVKLMIAYRLHFHEPYLQAIDIARRGDIGEPRYFSSVFSHVVRDDDIRMQADTGGGALYDLGTYQVNAARSCLGEPIRVRGVQMHENSVDVMTSVILEFDGGAVASFICHQKSADTSEMHVVGTKGLVTLEPAFDYSMGLGLCVKIGDDEDEREFKKTDQFAPELVTFSRCVLEDDEPEPNGEEGLGDVRVLEAIVESARTGTPVDLPRWDRDRRPTMDQAIEKPAVKPPEPVNAPSPSR